MLPHCAVPEDKNTNCPFNKPACHPVDATWMTTSNQQRHICCFVLFCRSELGGGGLGGFRVITLRYFWHVQYVAIFLPQSFSTCWISSVGPFLRRETYYYTQFSPPSSGQKSHLASLREYTKSCVFTFDAHQGFLLINMFSLNRYRQAMYCDVTLRWIFLPPFISALTLRATTQQKGKPLVVL